MKKLIPFIACIAFLVLSGLAQNETLTNAEIVSMSKAGIEKAVIISKIRTSATNFDTSTGALIQLKEAGVADDVVAAMFPSPVTASSQATTAVLVDQTIPDGTEVEVQLKNNLSGEEAKLGDVVDLSVVRNVTVNGVPVISESAGCTARITNAKKAGHWGKTGKLEWAMQDCQTLGGNRIPMRFTKNVTGGSSGGTVAVGAVLTTVLLGPVGLLWGLKKGKKAVIPAGSKFSVFVDKDSVTKVKTPIP
ncbi:MAG: hypothetical protein ABIO36_00275 [Pyrinomonadaceae bacterium]